MLQLNSDVALLSYDEIASKPGYYLSLASALVYKNNGRVDKATKEILHDHGASHKVFALIVEGLDLGQEAVRELAAEKFGIEQADIKGFVHNDND